MSITKILLSAVLMFTAELGAQTPPAPSTASEDGPVFIQIDMSQPNAIQKAKAEIYNKQFQLKQGQALKVHVTNFNPYVYKFTVNANVVRGGNSIGDGFRKLLAFLGEGALGSFPESGADFGEPVNTKTSLYRAHSKNLGSDPRNPGAQTLQKIPIEPIEEAYKAFADSISTGRKKLAELAQVQSSVETKLEGQSQYWIDAIRKQVADQGYEADKDNKYSSSIEKVGNERVNDCETKYAAFVFAITPELASNPWVSELRSSAKSLNARYLTSEKLLNGFKSAGSAIDQILSPSTYIIDTDPFFAEGISIQLNLKREYLDSWLKDNPQPTTGLMEGVISLPVLSAQMEDFKASPWWEPQSVEVSAGYGLLKHHLNTSFAEKAYNAPGMVLIHGAYRQSQRVWLAWTLGAGFTSDASVLMGGSVLLGQDTKLVISCGPAISKGRSLEPAVETKGLKLGWFFGVSLSLPKLAK